MRRCLGLALHAREAVAGRFGGFHVLAYHPGGIAPLDAQFGEIAHGFAGAALVQLARGRLDHLAVAGLVEVAFPSASHQQHPLGEGAVELLEQQGGAELAVHVAAPEHLGQCSARGLVQRLCRRGHPTTFMDAHHQGRGTLLFRTAALDAVIHRLSSPCRLGPDDSLSIAGACLRVCPTQAGRVVSRIRFGNPSPAGECCVFWNAISCGKCSPMPLP